MTELTPVQVAAYYGMWGAGAALFVLLIVENHFLRKRHKLLKELLDDYRAEKALSDKLIDMLKLANIEYIKVLRQLGVMAPEEEKPRLDG